MPPSCHVIALAHATSPCPLWLHSPRCGASHGCTHHVATLLLLAYPLLICSLNFFFLLTLPFEVQLPCSLHHPCQQMCGLLPLQHPPWCNTAWHNNSDHNTTYGTVTTITTPYSLMTVPVTPHVHNDSTCDTKCGVTTVTMTPNMAQQQRP